MKEYPILFSAPMVRAILNGTKTQTRRVLKPQPDGWIRGSSGTIGVPKKITSKKPHKNGSIWQEEDGTCYDDINCPFGKVGDRLWVRETWQKTLSGKYIYRSDYPDGYKADHTATGDWKPSIFMPRAASRITLEIIHVRVERLQGIIEQDAIAEGVKTNAQNGIDDYNGEWWNYTAVDFDDYPCSSAVESYETLWTSINGPESWAQNPFVWVISFVKV